MACCSGPGGTTAISSLQLRSGGGRRKADVAGCCAVAKCAKDGVKQGAVQGPV